MFRAVIFDLGGVVFPSPFEAFDAYDRDAGLAPGTVRGLIGASSETGAWAALERGELALPDFYAELEREATAAEFRLDAAKLMAGVASGFGPGPAMATAIRRIRESNLRTAPRPNNWPPADEAGAQFPPTADALGFARCVESAVVGL